MYSLVVWLPRLLVLGLAAGLAAGWGCIWLPVSLVVLVAWGRGFPTVP